MKWRRRSWLLKFEDWVEWEKSLVHYLNGVRNRKGVPLSYVICGTQPQNVQLSSDEQMIYAAMLQGPQFNYDNKQVYNLIYDGPDQAKARIDVARACIKKLFYKNKNMFLLNLTLLR